MSVYTGAPQLSDAGTVVFAANRVGGFTGAGVFKGSGGALTPIIATDTELRTLIDPAISPAGIIAYEWKTLNQLGAPIADNLYVIDNGVTTPIATTASLFFDFIAVNDHGQVAASSTHAIQIGAGAGPLTTIADTLGPYGNFRELSINDDGQVAFYATLAAGGAGIFTGADSISDKVIATGDPLLGSTVSEIAFGRRGLNDNGQIAFWARLANGQQGIFVATPVPEPNSIVLLLSAAGLLGIAGYRRRRQSLRASSAPAR
jgi:hypothetical protein